MDTKEIFKKFWFVGLIAVLFVCFIIVYIVQMIQNQPVVKEPKEENGQYLIYSINGENYTADEFYQDLYDDYATTVAYNRFDKEVCEKAIATTDEMKNIAASNAAYLLEQYGEEELKAQMQSLGYDEADDAYDYYIYIQKSLQLRTDYLKEHTEDILNPFIEENHPKLISHILIKVADVSETTDDDGNVTYTANPTDEEKQKLDDVLNALENGEDFASVAMEYSDDSSASQGGYLGYFDDNNSTYVEVFADTAKTLSGNQTSEVITSEYGYHIIYCNSDNIDDLLTETDFVNAIFADYPSAYYDPLTQAAKELGINIDDETIAKNIEDDIAKATASENTDSEQETESEAE